MFCLKSFWGKKKKPKKQTLCPSVNTRICGFSCPSVEPDQTWFVTLYMFASRIYRDAFRFLWCVWARRLRVPLSTAFTGLSYQPSRNSHFLSHRLAGHCCFVLWLWCFVWLWLWLFSLEQRKPLQCIRMPAAPAVCKLTPSYFLQSLVFCFVVFFFHYINCINCVEFVILCSCEEEGVLCD